MGKKHASVKSVVQALCKFGFYLNCNCGLKHLFELSFINVSMSVHLCRNESIISSSDVFCLHSTVAVRITDNHFRHSECYTCTDCGLNLKMRGHFWVGDMMYCEKHAKERHQGLASIWADLSAQRLWDGVRWALVVYMRQDGVFFNRILQDFSIESFTVFIPDVLLLVSEPRLWFSIYL